ncbi:hypothetical protein A2899_00620 [Candidatus Amesbacteria bacterium RIFCSPLOWO2_01_FULL_49_25]|nr:MAG: hypothetical protein A2899_00620 [Candidatus Amesbacteria bacterium RIFCSPLOWO2_01_FULL_49_25]
MYVSTHIWNSARTLGKSVPPPTFPPRNPGTHSFPTFRNSHIFWEKLNLENPLTPIYLSPNPSPQLWRGE